MTQTNTDYLLQITAAVPDRIYSATGANNSDSGFDNHLSQAATLSGDDSRNLGSGSQRTDAARLDRDDRSWNTNGGFKPSRHDSENTSTSQASQSDQQESTDAVSESKSSADDENCDEHESEKADDTTAAEVAGASQTAKDNQPKSAAKPEPKESTDQHAAAKAAAINTNAATEANNSKATGASDVQATGSSPAEDSSTLLAANAATEIAKTNEEPVESQAAVSEDKQSKGVKRDASTPKSHKDSSAGSSGTACDNEAIDATGTGEIPVTAAKKSDETAGANPAVAGATAVKSKSEVNESTDDDSHNDTRASSRNDATTQTNKVDTAQLAVSTASPTDASANTTLKGKDGELSTKPITAKGEPAAVAFARMTRNNVTGSSDSATGTNDLPQ